ncbi:MAG: Mur ligase family protein [Candidatus Saccharimonadales bacterium]
MKTAISAWLAAGSHGLPTRHLQIIVVTGSDGSSSTVAFLAEILKAAGERVGVITQNYVEIAGERASGSDQAGILDEPYKLQALLAQMHKSKCRYVLIEMPASIPAHKFVGVPLTMVVVRRCGDSHVDQASVMSRKTAVGRILSRQPRYIVLNHDDACYDDLVKYQAEELRMTYGAHQQAECRIRNVHLHPKGSSIELIIDHQTGVSLTTELPGKQAIYSVVAAAAAAYMLHVSIEHIESGIANIRQIPFQFEQLSIERPFNLVLDSSSTPEGIAEILETLKHFAHNRVIVVLGGQLGQSAHWRPVIGEIAAKYADRIVLTDGDYAPTESALTVREGFRQGVFAASGEAMLDEVPDRMAAFEKALSIARRGDAIVICSAAPRPYRQVGTERVAWDDKGKIEELLGG